MRASPLHISEASAKGMRCIVVASRFNGEIVERLVAGALHALESRGADKADQAVVWVPGALEIPMVAQAILARKKKRPDAIICVGCVIKGGTDHYEHVCRATVDGVMRVGLDNNQLVTNGVLTVATLEQANERSHVAGTAGNKGAEAALAAIDTWAALQGIGNL